MKIKNNIETNIPSVGYYNQPLLFYFLATLIPWLFWFAAGFISHKTPENDLYSNLASVIAFVGLLAR